VIATARDVNGSALKKLAEAHPGRLRVEALDVNDQAQQRALTGKLGGPTLDLLFVNAGITERAELAEVSQEAFTNVMLTNVLSPVQIALALRDRMRRGGTVAFMSSRMGSIAEMNVGNSAVYRASKAALNALTRCFVGEVGAGKFTVLSFHPGWVRTDMGGPMPPSRSRTACAASSRCWTASEAAASTNSSITRGTRSPGKPPRYLQPAPSRTSLKRSSPAPMYGSRF